MNSSDKHQFGIKNTAVFFVWLGKTTVSPIFIRPAGVSPIETSKKTTGRDAPAGASSEDDMALVGDRLLEWTQQQVSQEIPGEAT